MSRVWKSKQELCELAVRLRHTNGAGPQSATLQAESRHARAFAWLGVLDDVIHLWAEEARVAALKPAEPIVWDGTDLAWVRVRAALPAGMEATARVDASMTIYRSSDDRILATVIRGGRIRIEGDSFAILPPEEVAGA